MTPRKAIGRLLGPPTYDEVSVARHFLPRRGLMIDVGAHHGDSLLPFAESGWEIFAFEPDPANLALLETAVMDRPNVTVDNRAIAERDELELDLYVSDVSPGISSLKPFHDSHRPGSRVRTVRLDTYLAEHRIQHVTFLKTDTEGFDLPVLRTFPWTRYRPHVVICEFENRKTDPLGYRHEDLANFLVDKGYTVFSSEWYPIAEYGQLHTWRSIHRYPAPLIDNNGWGNLIAVSPELSARAGRALRRAGRLLRIRNCILRLIGKP